MSDDDDQDYRRGPGEQYRPPAPAPRHYRRGEDRWTEHLDRKAALTVRCRYCGASIDVICRNRHAGPGGAELPFDESPPFLALPAHPIRVADAKRGPKQL